LLGILVGNDEGLDDTLGDIDSEGANDGKSLGRWDEDGMELGC